MIIEKIIGSLDGLCLDNSPELFCCPPHEDAHLLWLEIQEKLEAKKIKFVFSPLSAWKMDVTAIYKGEFSLFFNLENGIPTFYWAEASSIKEVDYEEHILLGVERLYKEGKFFVPPVPEIKFGTTWDVHHFPGGLSLRATQFHAKPITVSRDGIWFYKNLLEPLKSKKKGRLLENDETGLANLSLAPGEGFKPC